MSPKLVPINLGPGDPQSKVGPNSWLPSWSNLCRIRTKDFKDMEWGAFREQGRAEFGCKTSILRTFLSPVLTRHKQLVEFRIKMDRYDFI